MNPTYTVIENANLVLETGILWDATLLLRNGRIAAYGKPSEMTLPSDAYRMDAKGAYVGPGFIDIHVHGGGGYSTCHDTEKAGKFFLSHGTTTFLATPVYSMPFDEFLTSIKEIKAAMPYTPNVRGMYMEGPYMNPAYGSNAHKNPWRHPLDPKEYKALVDEAGEHARVWAIAPEREGLLPFLEYARAVNPHTLFAVGHSEALPDEIRALGAYRPAIQTHSMNATGRRPVGGGLRGYGPDEYCWKDPEIYTEMISDSLGIHVNRDMQQLLIHTKGIHRVILITDSTNPDAPNPPEYAHVPDLNYDERGGIAGSAITMDQACKNVMTHTNCGIAQAFVMASLNPARVLGMHNERGSIAVGKIADLVFVDDRFNVKDVMLDGKICKF